MRSNGHVQQLNGSTRSTTSNRSRTALVDYHTNGAPVSLTREDATATPPGGSGTESDNEVTSERLLRRTLSNASVRGMTNGAINGSHDLNGIPRPGGWPSADVMKSRGGLVPQNDHALDDYRQELVVFNNGQEHTLRHGFGDQYDSEEYLALLEQVSALVVIDILC